MSVNDILQIAAVAIVLAMCIVWIVRRLNSCRRSGEESSCSGCPLAENCHSPKKRKSL